MWWKWLSKFYEGKGFKQVQFYQKNIDDFVFEFKLFIENICQNEFFF